MRSIRIGRLFGIDLHVDWSWVFIFVLMTWNLVAVFSHWHPSWPSAEAFAVAASASVVFFGCVLLHELAHSMVAMSYGIRVRSITLFLFGGVSNIEREPPSAKAKLFIAIVGPLTSIALGICALLLSSWATTASMTNPDSALAALSRLGPMTTLLVWLGPINVMIGLFNMLPGFPLDGGRVLRAIVWSATGDFRAATRWASASGQSIGWLFIIGGVAMSFGAHLPFFGTGFAGGLWLAFIGWFLNGAASAASRKLALDDALAGLTVEQLMQRHGPIATPDTSVATLVHEHLLPGDDRALPVVEDEMLVGLASISDVRAIAPVAWAVTRVGSIMRRLSTLTVATPEEPLVDAFEQIARQDIEQLPVVVNGRLVGMLRRRDITRWLELAWRPAAGAGVRTGEGPTPSNGSRPFESDVHHAT